MLYSNVLICKSTLSMACLANAWVSISVISLFTGISANVWSPLPVKQRRRIWADEWHEFAIKIITIIQTQQSMANVFSLLEEHFHFKVAVTLIEKINNSVFFDTIISMGKCKEDVTPLLTHWSYVFLALTHRYSVAWSICNVYFWRWSPKRFVMFSSSGGCRHVYYWKWLPITFVMVIDKSDKHKNNIRYVYLRMITTNNCIICHLRLPTRIFVMFVIAEMTTHRLSLS